MNMHHHKNKGLRAGLSSSSSSPAFLAPVSLLPNSSVPIPTTVASPLSSARHPVSKFLTSPRHTSFISWNNNSPNSLSSLPSSSSSSPSSSSSYPPRQQAGRRAGTIISELTQDDTAKQAEGRMAKTIDSVKASFNTVRTGRASPSLLDRVIVQYYGSDTPLNQIASVSVSGTSTLLVEPYDKAAVADIERALLEADTGLTPMSDGQTIRLAVPPLTQERRVSLVKQVKGLAEDGRVALRNIRRDAVDSVKKLEKKKALGKDESKSIQDDIQKLTDKYVKQIDALYKQKDADIMKV